MTLTRTSRRGLLTVVIAACVLILFYVVRVLWLYAGATEGDVSASSSIPLPDGSQVVNVSTDCASAGCWSIFDVRPPEDMTPKDLALQLGTDPQGKISGNLLDPRTIWLRAEQAGDLLSIHADYWSSEWVP
ncbi:hypothetical protein [Microbacterium sp. MPKO10]|uniref:hypothetical protein n=1 Tax=Microbacterium sp. MPKO10 TaxID=2989818 RepID=UPI0022358C57|nr:hypothetical protein [Microbacterium sp. MPKO10]MCW4457229.1 hypothetical protein [Microbacterium sp. MPKO10]